LALLLPAEAQFGGSRESRGARPGSFDFYVLALSWSAGFCELKGDERRSRQCDAGRGLDFVVHGLWPQYDNGYPSDCAADRFVPRPVLDSVKDLFPETGLAIHEWRKHGTCSGKSPSGYFADVRLARNKVKIPEQLKSLKKEAKFSPLEIERAFAAANPGLRPDMMAVSCRRGVLEEVRICLDRDLRGFHICPQVNRSGCRTQEITVPSIR
jgi:ribonuclease T2